MDAKQRGDKFHKLTENKLNGRYCDYQEDGREKKNDEVILDGWFTLEQLKIIVSAFEEVQE